MEDAKKIKRTNWIVQIALPIIILSVIFLLLRSILNNMTFRFILACIMILAGLMHILFLAKTRNKIYLIPTGFYTFAALTFVFATKNHPAITILLVVCTATLFVFLMYTLIKRKIKWRYREVLELAARYVADTGNGFTQRPYPVAHVTYSRDDITRFARFILKYGIAYPYYEKERVVFVIPQNMLLHLLKIRQNYLKETHIIFNSHGEVAVTITKNDYQKYQDELSFDQLCAALGSLFIDFLEKYLNDQGKEIIEKMNALKFVV